MLFYYGSNRLPESACSFRKDSLDKMETSTALMEDPTIDNYFAFFKEVVESKPGGDKPSSAITTAGDMAEINYTFDMAFGLDKTWLKKSDGTYKYAKVSGVEEKEKLAFYHKLYKTNCLTLSVPYKTMGYKGKSLSLMGKQLSFPERLEKSLIFITER